MTKQISASVSSKLKRQFDEKCDKEGRFAGITLRNAIEVFIDREFGDIIDEEEGE